MKTPAADTETQLQVLARIARRDTYDEISRDMGIPISTIGGIKFRNKAALEIMQSKMIEHKVTTSRKILNKAHNLIESKLDKVHKSEEVRYEALEAYRIGEIDYEELNRRLHGLTDATLAELNSVSREAFNQSQVESGRPTSISASPLEAKDDLMRLVEAIHKGDEVTLERLVFTSKDIDYIEAETD